MVEAITVSGTCVLVLSAYLRFPPLGPAENLNEQHEGANTGVREVFLLLLRAKHRFFGDLQEDWRYAQGG